ncbi:hypothetical protein CJF30_00001958 [Rutstroemia sp. NJR-2017a BBW]|nr:hypothetical protein CJF30_00001958 [Rutstroemia sp. NJR-2017a BBW]
MQFLALSTLLTFLLGLAHSAPINGTSYPETVNPTPTSTMHSRHNYDTPSVSITFYGASGSFQQTFPVDGAIYEITNELTISRIVADSGSGVCVINGYHNSYTRLEGPCDEKVYPAQVQAWGACYTALAEGQGDPAYDEFST